MCSQWRGPHLRVCPYPALDMIERFSWSVLRRPRHTVSILMTETEKTHQAHAGQELISTCVSPQCLGHHRGAESVREWIDYIREGMNEYLHHGKYLLIWKSHWLKTFWRAISKHSHSLTQKIYFLASPQSNAGPGWIFAQVPTVLITERSVGNRRGRMDSPGHPCSWNSTSVGRWEKVTLRQGQYLFSLMTDWDLHRLSDKKEETLPWWLRW